MPLQMTEGKYQNRNAANRSAMLIRTYLIQMGRERACRACADFRSDGCSHGPVASEPICTVTPALSAILKAMGQAGRVSFLTR